MLAFTAATRSIATHSQLSALLAMPEAATSASVDELIAHGRNHALCTGNEPFLQALLNLAGSPTELTFGGYFDQLTAAEQEAVVSALRSYIPGQSETVPGTPVDYELTQAPVVRVRLAAERTPPEGQDSMGRLVVGYRDGLDDSELWERARGPWRVEPVKMLRAKLLIVTSPSDVVVAVGTIDAISMPDGRVVVDGKPLTGHPLVGAPDPLPTSSPNPIAGGTLAVLAPIF